VLHQLQFRPKEETHPAVVALLGVMGTSNLVLRSNGEGGLWGFPYDPPNGYGRALEVGKYEGGATGQ
jgi:hypothetical protein